MSGKPVPLSRTTPWREVVVLCRKCRKKLDGGFGPDRRDSLKSALGQALRDAGQRRKVRIIETGCLGICPKRAVTALNATRPGTIHVIPAGTIGTEAMATLLRGNAAADGDRIETA